jgi:hypothetical protein
MAHAQDEALAEGGDVVLVRVSCYHPLHKSFGGYDSASDRFHRPKYAGNKRVVIVWPEDSPETRGKWAWCGRCAARERQRRHRLKHRPPRARTRLIGERFILPQSQTRFANKHSPPGERWCSRSCHYAPQQLFQYRGSSARGCCAWCRNLHRRVRRRISKAHATRKYRQTQDALHLLSQKRAVLAQEVRNLRAIQKSLEQRIVHPPAPLPDETLEVPLPQTQPRPWASQRKRPDNEKAYSLP